MSSGSHPANGPASHRSELSMEPHDESSTEPSFADSEPEASVAPAPAEDTVPVEPEVAAALLMSVHYSRALSDRVFSGLTPDEIGRLARGFITLKSTPEERLDRIWNRLTLLFTGDWREEDDLVEFIRCVMRKGFRQDPPLTPMQKLALLLLSLSEETATRITTGIMAGMKRASANELTRELAHLLHYQNAQVQERVLGELMAFAAARSTTSTRFMNLVAMEQEVERLVRRDVTSCADVAQRLWLQEGEILATFQEAARLQPRQVIAILEAFVRAGGESAYIPPLQRASIMRACLTQEAAQLLDDALKTDGEALPEPIVSTARKERVLHEFLHRYYLEYMRLVPVVLQ